MKKLLLLFFCALIGIYASAGTMTFTTDLPVGTKVKILLNTTSATVPVSIDWGNGVKINYTVDPNIAAYNRWIEATIEGKTITISGNITEVRMTEMELTSAFLENMMYLSELVLSDNKIVDFEIQGVTPLKTINLSNNNVTNSVYENTTLSLENAAETLYDVNLAHNPGLSCLDIRYLENLQYLTAYDCPDLASIFICMPEDSRPNLRSLDLHNCDLSHFYPVSLPNLRTLTLGNNKLMTEYDDDPFVLGSYPELTSLDISNNVGIKSLDMTGCTKLEYLNISGNKFKYLDVSQAPELSTIVANDNNISTFDLGNNLKLKTIHIAGNPVKELDLSIFPYLSSVDISDTKISRVMLMKAFYLTDFAARNTEIEFIDFNGQQAGRMNKIDLRDNKKMTGETVDYTIHTLPEAKSNSWSTAANLLLSGSNAETADTDFAEDLDHHWICDVKGNATATHSKVAVTLEGSTDTGENKTGRLDRLYPNFGMGMDYDFDIYETNGGKFLISQWQPKYFQSMLSVSSEALTGVPIHIYPYPEEGKRFKSVTVNGKEIESQWFVISEPSTIKVNFTSLENSLSFNTKRGQALSFLVNTTESNGSVWIDWGTGTRTEYPGQNKYTSGYYQIGGQRIDGSAASETVTLYGDIAALDLSGYGDVAEDFGLWDNAITSINLNDADNLKFLSLYWNPVKSLDLSGAPNLEVLDVSYTALEDLDLSHTPNIMWLEAYADNWDEGDIRTLKNIDVSCLPILQYLNVKNNDLTSLDLSKNPYLFALIATNNNIRTIDVSNNPLLEELEISNNQISTIDLSNLKELTSLVIAGNSLTSLDLSNNVKLETLDIANNYLKVVDTSMLPDLKKIYLNGNGMSADDLNDTYYLLPQRKPDTDGDGLKTGWNLAVIQGLDRDENDGMRADSSIAIDRDWTPSHQGSNGGSEFAYLDILSSLHGNVKVKDENGNVYNHGSKVPKFIELTIEAAPEDGYKMATFSLNGEEAQSGNTFTMPGIYTKLRTTFVKDSGVDNLANSLRIFTVSSGIVIECEEGIVDIISANGHSFVSGHIVNDNELFGVEPGVYVVRISSSAGVRTEKVVVK